MNIFQQLLALFGRQYILLIFHSGIREIRHAYILGGRVYADPYLPRTRVELRRGGKAYGRSYIHSWLPITRKVKSFYSDGDYIRAVEATDKAEATGRGV